MKYKVGDKVVCNDSGYTVYGQIGVIVEVDEKFHGYEVRFQKTRLFSQDLFHFEHEVRPIMVKKFGVGQL